MPSPSIASTSPARARLRPTMTNRHRPSAGCARTAVSTSFRTASRRRASSASGVAGAHSNAGGRRGGEGADIACSRPPPPTTRLSKGSSRSLSRDLRQMVGCSWFRGTRALRDLGHRLLIGSSTIVIVELPEACPLLRLTLTRAARPPCLTYLNPRLVVLQASERPSESIGRLHDGPASRFSSLGDLRLGGRPFLSRSDRHAIPRARPITGDIKG